MHFARAMMLFFFGPNVIIFPLSQILNYDTTQKLNKRNQRVLIKYKKKKRKKLERCLEGNIQSGLRFFFFF